MVLTRSMIAAALALASSTALAQGAVTLYGGVRSGGDFTDQNANDASVNLKSGAKLLVARPIVPEHDHVAVVGDNRKLVVFSLEELPVMARGQGVTLQRYRDGGLADATTFKLDEGLSWAMGGETGRTRTETEISMCKVARGAAGRLPPQGFPRDNKF